MPYKITQDMLHKAADELEAFAGKEFKQKKS